MQHVKLVKTILTHFNLFKKQGKEKINSVVARKKPLMLKGRVQRSLLSTL